MKVFRQQLFSGLQLRRRVLAVPRKSSYCATAPASGPSNYPPDAPLAATRSLAPAQSGGLRQHAETHQAVSAWRSRKPLVRHSIAQTKASRSGLER